MPTKRPVPPFRVKQNRDPAPLRSISEDTFAIQPSARSRFGSRHRGLRAQLEIESLVTGMLYVSLDMKPDAPLNLLLPLEKNFTQVLSGNLSELVGTHQVAIYPWYRSTPVDYQIRIDVSRFETDSSGNAVLATRWTITDSHDQRLVYAGNSNLSEAIRPGDPAAEAAALSRALGNFSREVAAAIKDVQDKPRPRIHHDQAPAG